MLTHRFGIFAFTLLVSLQEQLDVRKNAFANRASAELLECQNRALHELEISGVYERVLKVG